MLQTDMAELHETHGTSPMHARLLIMGQSEREIHGKGVAGRSIPSHWALW